MKDLSLNAETARRGSWISALAGLVVAIAVASCASPGRIPVLTGPEALPTRSGFPLKIHLQSGDLAVLDDWEEVNSTIVGVGELYGPDRSLLLIGLQRIPLRSVALFETSVRAEGVDGMYTFGTGLMVGWTVMSGAGTISCLADPKSCFGSCPTFYVDGVAGEELVAEGFSASIARVLEARDVDALPTVSAGPGLFEIVMRNEALETHAVRSVRLLAVPRPWAGGVVATATGELRAVGPRIPATSCLAPEGDCLATVSARDANERRSWADSTDLAAREFVEITFPAVSGPHALVIGARHTFVSTFLFYQSLAYLGTQAGPLVAAIERGDEALRNAVTGPMRLLGSLHVDVWSDSEGWTRIGTFDEAGPLATDEQAIPLPPSNDSGPLRVRLDLVQGYWRIDEITLAALGEAVHPRVLEPIEVLRHGRPDPEALRKLLDPAVHFATFPGEEFVLRFEIPDDAEAFDLFLESEGYYYEWMREVWLEEEDPIAAAMMLTRPEEMFRRLAPAFKGREKGMEEMFWASRIRGRLP